MIDLRQTPEYARYMEATGWKVEKLDKTYVFIKRILFFGNAIKIQRPDKLNYSDVETLIGVYRPFQIFIEPKDESDVKFLNAKGFRLSQSYFLPSKTIHIDLRKTDKVLLNEMHYKTRYNIKKATHKPLLITSSSKDILSFADFWQKCALMQRGMYLSSKKEIVEIYKAFLPKADILLALQYDKVISGILLIHANKISYYMYAASSDVGKKLFAPTLLAWKAILTSKKRGSEVFDFEGIYDERFPLKSWLGFSRFKKSFGGKEIEYPGTYQKFLLPFFK